MCVRRSVKIDKLGMVLDKTILIRIEDELKLKGSH